MSDIWELGSYVIDLCYVCVEMASSLVLRNLRSLRRAARSLANTDRERGRRQKIQFAIYLDGRHIAHKLYSNKKKLEVWGRSQREAAPQVRVPASGKSI